MTTIKSTTSCEVFDGFSRKFTIIKPGIKFQWSDAICIGNNIVVFHNCYEVRTETTVCLYDVVQDKCTMVKRDFTKYFFDLCYVKIYRYLSEFKLT